MLFKEVVAVYRQNHTTRKPILKNKELLVFKTAGIYITIHFLTAVDSL
jgi:hypothetical protein